MNITIGKGGESLYSYYGSTFGQDDQDGGDTIISFSGGIVFTAQGGEQGTSFSVGAGWSGGGGYYGGVGGFNGGNGGDGDYYGQDGGAGQGTSLPSIEGLTITAGAGGQSCYGCYGGGGGGVIINGDGGRRNDNRASQGYGSGGGRFGRNGQSGVVILYV